MIVHVEDANDNNPKFQPASLPIQNVSEQAVNGTEVVVLKVSGFIGATTCDFQQCGILKSADSDEHVQPFLKFSNSRRSMLCQGQDFWGTPVSPYLYFRGTFANSGGHTESI